MKAAHKDKFTLGIYGDGQLARLLALSALKHQISVLIYSLDAGLSPCKDLAPLQQGTNWTDKKSFEDFCERCETVVLENEFVPAEFLRQAEHTGTRILPDANSFSLVSNKLKQVKLCQQLGIKIPPFILINHPEELQGLTLPVMLKCLSGGYDGYGNFTFKNQSQLAEAKEFILNAGPALAQDFLEFETEVAVFVVSNGTDYLTFPVVETIQQKNICHYVVTPPRFSEQLQATVKAEAIKIIQAIKGVGIFGVEFFKMDNEIIFNEIAPRPHNSGHYSIEGCNYSQFDALIKLILHQPLEAPVLKTPAVGMLNLLGTQNGKANFQGDKAFYQNPKGFLHLYGKEDSRIGRKMGHFTLLGYNQEQLLEELAYLRSRYQI